MRVPPIPVHALRDTSECTGDILSACGIVWDASDIARFLSFCHEDRDGCLIWSGAKSRGRGNSAWYGSFSPTFTPHAVRAHKFYAVAVLGLRPKTGIHHLDHTCTNPLCVRHVDCVPESVNLKLRWIRFQVGLDEDVDREEAIRLRMEKWLLEKGKSSFSPDDADNLWARWVRQGHPPENIYVPDPFDPRYW